jgi:hypothetical protein
MFYFGNPEDSADIFYENAKSGPGPEVSDLPLEGMSEDELRIAFTYLYRTVRQSIEAEASEEILDVVTARYDKAFCLMIERSERFRLAVDQGRHAWVTGYNKETIDKYKRLAREHSSAS